MKFKYKGGAIFLIPAFLTILFITFFQSCKKTDNPLGLYAPNGFDVPSPTATPAHGAFNCYVYDNGGKQGVTVILLDPALSNPVTNLTDQFGNAIFNPYPLIVGTYTAEVPAQGRYGLSALPITITNVAQGAVSCTFTAASQALTITSGAPASFVSGNGTFNIGVSYVQPGSLDVPITVTTNSLPSAWNASPATFVLGMNNPATVLSVNKTACAVLNLPVSISGTDFLGVPFCFTNTSFFKNFPVNIQLNLVQTTTTCTCFGSSCHNAVNLALTLNSPNDCGTSWTLTVGSKVFTISNGQTVNINGTDGSPCKAVGTVSASLSSVLGNASGSGVNGVIINSNF